MPMHQKFYEFVVSVEGGLMLDYVDAVRFDRRMNRGRTWPCLIACSHVDGEEIEVIAKFSGPEMSVSGLAKEAISAMLAADLEIPVPNPLLVRFDDDFIDLVALVDREMGTRLRGSVKIAFGSTKLPPGFILPNSSFTDATVRAEAAEIFAFDALIQNPDRKTDNPNCLHNGRSFAIFDHELCFVFDTLFWSPPWELGSLDFLKNQHVFYPGLVGRTHDLNRLKDAWRGIPNLRFDEYLHALPIEWLTNRGNVDEIIPYLKCVRDNIDSAMVEITRILS